MGRTVNSAHVEVQRQYANTHTPFLGQHLMGMAVIFSTSAGTWDRKILPWKSWHGKNFGCYFSRVQKKWNKRWPPVFKPGMYLTHDRIVVHPLYWPTLRNELELKGVIFE